MNQPIVVTGLGTVTAFGNDVGAFWGALTAGRSGLRAEPAFGSEGTISAACVDEPARRPLKGMDAIPRAVQLAVLAAGLAWSDAGIGSTRERVGLVVGTGLGNLDALDCMSVSAHARERVNPAAAFRGFTHAAACEIAGILDIRGPMLTISTGCNSGADAIGVARDWLTLGRCDTVLVGGTEAELTPIFLTAMRAARALTRRNVDAPAASRPFDAGRTGNVPGEGAAFLVLENAQHATARAARAYAALTGFATLSAGRRPEYNPFDPPFDLSPLVDTMRAALNDAGLDPKDVAAVSANGSSSLFYDRLEAAAISQVFGHGDVPVHSIKGALGQTGAVSSCLQAIVAALTIHHGVVPPTCNAEDLDPRCVIDLVRGASRACKAGAVLTNAIGFGGAYNTSMIFAPAMA
jgi:3-oxoacyl-[acyl-carrier-protein] synthase II